MNNLSAIQGYCRAIALPSNPGQSLDSNNRLSETISVLEVMPKTSVLSGIYLKELALVIARPDLKPAGVFITQNVYDQPNDALLAQKIYEKLQRLVLPIPFAIERVRFVPDHLGVKINREFLMADPISKKRDINSSFENWWGITNKSRSLLHLNSDLYYNVNPYWKEFMRNGITHQFINEQHTFEEFVIYVGASEEKLASLLLLRETGYSKEDDLKRGKVLGIPEEAANEFCSLTPDEQIEANNRVADAIENGILPSSLRSAWWWTTINCIGRPEEIRLANEVDSFYKQLERASSPELLQWLSK